MAMPRLFVYPKKGDSFWHILKKEKTMIGRSEDNDLALPDPFSSGHHAVIIPADGGFCVRDNGSKNGTFLNGRKVQGRSSSEGTRSWSGRRGSSSKPGCRATSR
jgi:predicted component of type VI protein secretion system